MKQQLILLSGVSGSGKSTFSANRVQTYPSRYVVVNRDKIRELLYAYTEDSVQEYYNHPDFNQMERQVTETEDMLIEHFLNLGKTVIVDATHLKIKYLNRFDKFNFEKKIIFFNITLKEALIRNQGRKRKVPEEIIINQYNLYVDLRKNLNLKYDYDLQEIDS